MGRRAGAVYVKAKGKVRLGRQQQGYMGRVYSEVRRYKAAGAAGLQGEGQVQASATNQPYPR